MIPRAMSRRDSGEPRARGCGVHFISFHNIKALQQTEQRGFFFSSPPLFWFFLVASDGLMAATPRVGTEKRLAFR